MHRDSAAVAFCMLLRLYEGAVRVQTWLDCLACGVVPWRSDSTTNAYKCSSYGGSVCVAKLVSLVGLELKAGCDSVRVRC